MALLHPLLNNVTVLDPPVLLTDTLVAIIGRLVVTRVPIKVLIRVTLLVATVRKRVKLKCRWAGAIKEFPRLMRPFSILCRVPRSRRAVERPR